MYNLAEITVSYKPLLSVSKQPQITNSLDIYEILKQCWGEHIAYCEEFKIVLLNRANRVLGISNISVGGMSGTIADPKKIFQSALKGNAASIILAHNHPSGNLKPSQSDLELTKKIREAGIFMDLPVLDHIIMTDEGFLSFADEGLM